MRFYFLGKFDKIMKGTYMNWEDDLRQEINNVGCFTESEVNDLVMVFQDKIRETFHEFWKEIDSRVENPADAMICIYFLEEINKILESKGIKGLEE